ncbi:MAG: guanosine monophosphate reductase [Candidatus Taylorbacteria bacterium CG11_big_fil_rev_8_21_14_0_20_46_11]|uniref:Guanosine monophosphate reductase n=1 Tax=Candidatus Taylorbacteria bacterium CG11_big_fil_rev_8_21_14_0_20_46_11 TaxID=1975025 RepID=A0A2H0KD38_9BACT|nr:MAG: guanosine monophosphate reductase [Candidatus Taylorbacteria bacterium CG11_big_fil_rev_8_21_14_0_20_46_11]
MIRLGLTFDDVLLEPRKTAVNRRDASVETRLSKKARLAIPLLSAASDTVSDARFAIALGKCGGMAVLHRNCSLEEQVKMVKEVVKAGVAVGAGVGPKDVERAVALSEAGASAIFIDCAHAHAPGIISAMKEMKRRFKSLASQTRHSLLQRENKSLPPKTASARPTEQSFGRAPFMKGRIQTQLIVGNIVTKEAARDFASVADAFKVGIGPGSICTTRIVSGVGVPQLTAIMDVVSVAKAKKIPVIADGGIRTSGDIVKALAAGASSVMLGSLFAGSEEAPGEVITVEGKKYKSYRGMGSKEALEKRHAVDRYTVTDNIQPTTNNGEGAQKGKMHVVEGVAGKVLYRGTVADIVEQLVGGIKSGMGYIGAKTIEDMPKQARFIQITGAGLSESHPHSLE